MSGLIAAVFLFAAIAALVAGMRAEGASEASLPGDSPRRLPDPGPRDMHAVTGTLGHAPVPSWG